MTTKINLLLWGLILLFLAGCEEDTEIAPPVPTDEETPSPTQVYDLQGFVQKGPFINGTAITISELYFVAGKFVS